jgi:nicotinamidase-related amidase
MRGRGHGECKIIIFNFGKDGYSNMGKRSENLRERQGLRSILTIAVSLLIVFTLPTAACAQDVIEEWGGIKTPPPPALKQVTINPKTTALLLLDFNYQTCNMERRPRCVASIPAVKKLLAGARSKGVSIIYSLSVGAAPADISKELTPLPGEPVVTSGPDKFLGTELEKILREKNIATVIVTGTAANGAVLYTASGAALRGLDVIIPVEGISAETLYIEQYTLWNLANAPRVSAKITITRTGMIGY